MEGMKIPSLNERPITKEARNYGDLANMINLNDGELQDYEYVIDDNGINKSELLESKDGNVYLRYKSNNKNGKKLYYSEIHFQRH